MPQDYSSMHTYVKSVADFILAEQMKDVVLNETIVGLSYHEFERWAQENHPEDVELAMRPENAMRFVLFVRRILEGKITFQ